MFRPAFRAATAARSIPKGQQIGRRFASTAASRSGTWKGAALRWTAAGAIVYYYNTSNVFAEEPQNTVHAPLETSHEPETYRTVDSIAEQRRAQARAHLHSASPTQQADTQQTVAVPDGEQVAAGGPGALEDEAEQQGAFNEETGEINWDCPCLGGMAHGPCGEQFRAAFSCFVYSREEPKGVECIEHFKTMQNCFRDHPELYGAELDDDEVAEVQAEEDRAQAAQAAKAQAQAVPAEGKQAEHERVQSATAQVKQTAQPQSETDEVVPKAWHDGRGASTDKLSVSSSKTTVL